MSLRFTLLYFKCYHPVMLCKLHQRKWLLLFKLILAGFILYIPVPHSEIQCAFSGGARWSASHNPQHNIIHNGACDTPPNVVRLCVGGTGLDGDIEQGSFCWISDLRIKVIIHIISIPVNLLTPVFTVVTARVITTGPSILRAAASCWAATVSEVQQESNYVSVYSSAKQTNVALT